MQAQVLPQLAANGEDVESADDAAWVVDATIADAEEGTAVTLVAKDDDGWSDVDEQETDAKGRVSLTSRDSGDLHVVVGDGDDAIGTKVSTDDAPEATFTDDFDDEDSVDDPDGCWHTRDQGYTGVRTCSKASADAAEVADGVLRLSVTGGPRPRGRRVPAPREAQEVPLPAQRPRRHRGPAWPSPTASLPRASRRRRPAASTRPSGCRRSAGRATGGPKKGGAEIDVIEYFGDDHPEGGLTSFTYFLDKDGKKQTVGGWLPNADELGDDWAEQYHVFSVEWTPDEYVFRIDDKVTQRLKGVDLRASGVPHPQPAVVGLRAAALQRRAARDHGGRLGAGVGDGPERERGRRVGRR